MIVKQVPGTLPICQKASQSLPPAGGKSIEIIFCRGVYLAKNTSQSASVEFVRLWRTNYARGRLQAFCPKWASPILDRKQVPGADAPGTCYSILCYVPLWAWAFSGSSFSGGRGRTRISMTRRCSTRVTHTSRPSAWNRSPTSGTRPISSMTQPDTVEASYSSLGFMSNRSYRSSRSAEQATR